MSAFLSVNSSESRMFDFSIPQRIVQLAPVWSKETFNFSIGEANVLADIGTGGNSDELPLPAFFLIIRVQLLLESFASETT